MLEMPIAFIDEVAYAVEQICKRAQNLLKGLNDKRYVISEKKWFRTKYYEVNVFGDLQHKYGDAAVSGELLELMLREGYIKSDDYQLLTFYDKSGYIDDMLATLYDRVNCDVVYATEDEVLFLLAVIDWEENPELTIEELLSGE